MKDATGELSMTAVAVVAIAAIGVVFTTLIWPQIRQNILRSTYCSQAFDCGEPDDGKVTCKYCKDDACNETPTITCPDNTSGGKTNKATN